ncbi:MAG: sulfur carrier protein ThiS [Planctomycetes bacterium]|nr:sulfur carrier protein ThiS [Planctomycetota bacterium]
MKIHLNGQQRELSDGSAVSDLIAELKLHPQRVAVELNKQLVPRSRHSATRLSEDDRIEVVTLVGGG